ncbi:MAG: hypothetical protein RXO29_04670 [Desulfurococcales archaeon]
MDVNAKKAPIFLLLAISLASTAVFASVFVYYPVSIAATPQAPPIIFSAGSNSNATDLGGKQITVSISDANTSLSITVHPTYQTTYYKNIAVINNVDSKAYYVAFRVNSAASDTNLQSANLIIKDSSGNQIAIINLMSTGTSNWYQVPAGAQYSVDLNITYSAGYNTYNQAPGSGSGFAASLQLIYSPQNNESAP